MSLKKPVKEASYQCILNLVSKTPFFYSDIIVNDNVLYMKIL
jgi:hypothetical protein